MEILQTKQQLRIGEQSKRLEFLRELNEREGLNEDLKRELNRLERKYKGELTVLNALAEFGEDHWIVIQNAPLDDEGVNKCDLLLITNTSFYLFTVKHYSGRFDFKGKDSFINGEVYKFHPMIESQFVTLGVKSVLGGQDTPLDVQGAVIFSHEHCDVQFQGPVEYPYDDFDESEPVTSSELQDYIRGIADKERYHQGALTINKEKFLNRFQYLEDLKINSEKEEEKITN